MRKTILPIVSLVIISGVVLFARPAGAQVSQEVIDSISTPNEVETSIGTLTQIRFHTSIHYQP